MHKVLVLHYIPFVELHDIVSDLYKFCFLGCFRCPICSVVLKSGQYFTLAEMDHFCYCMNSTHSDDHHHKFLHLNPRLSTSMKFYALKVEFLDVRFL